MRRRFFTELNTNKYFSIEILGDGDINFIFNVSNIEYYNLLKYSKNNIKNWKSIQGVTFPIELSDIIYFKCAKWNNLKIEGDGVHVSAPCKIKGNPLSLCGYTPNTNTDFYYFLSNINVIEIDDSFWRNISMDNDLYTGLFADNNYITSINIPNYITNIPSSFFLNCENLVNIILPNSVTSIGNSAFYSCSSLTSVTIPDSVTTIEDYAFEGCSSLTSVTIPDSVTKLGRGAFWDCSRLTSVYCKATTPPNGGESMFDSNASDRKIYVPMESVGAYKSVFYWRNYADAIVGYNF